MPRTIHRLTAKHHETGIGFGSNSDAIAGPKYQQLGLTKDIAGDLHEAVSANPFIEFYLLAMESGRLEFIWEEDGGSTYRLEHQLAVA